MSCIVLLTKDGEKELCCVFYCLLVYMSIKISNQEIQEKFAYQVDRKSVFVAAIEPSKNGNKTLLLVQNRKRANVAPRNFVLQAWAKEQPEKFTSEDRLYRTLVTVPANFEVEEGEVFTGQNLQVTRQAGKRENDLRSNALPVINPAKKTILISDDQYVYEYVDLVAGRANDVTCVITDNMPIEGSEFEAEFAQAGVMAEG